MNDETGAETAQNAFAQLFEHFADAVFLLDGEIFVDCNPAAVEMIRCARKEDLLARTPAAIAPERQPDGTLSPAKVLEMNAVAQERGSHRFEWLMRRADGEVFFSEVLLTATTFGGEDSTYAIVRDITARKRAEAALQTRAEQVSRHQTALMELAKTDNSDFESSLRSITQTAAQTLNVERVSVWLFNADCTHIVCENLFQTGANRHSKGSGLWADDYPRYFQALHGKRVIAAHDARAHPDTSEFTQSYLEPLRIAAMLDVPIWRHGRMVGVICHEHTGSTREWTSDEQDFAVSVADLIALAMESSERKQAQEALSLSEARFRTMFEQFPLSIHILAPDGRTLDVNQAWQTLFGLNVADLQNMNLLEEPQLQEQGIVPFLARGFAGESVTLPEMLIDPARISTLQNKSRPTVPPFWVQATICPVKDEAGHISEVILTHQNITERKKAEETLRESEASYRSLFDNLRDLIYIMDENGQFLDVNPAVIEMYGYSREEVLGNTPAMFAAMELVDMEETGALIQKAVSGEPQRFDWWGRRKDGSIFPKEVSLGKAVYFGQDVLLASGRDTTAAKQAETALQQAHNALQKAHEELERRVEERAAELAQANGDLRAEIIERRRAEEELNFQKTLLESQQEASIDGILFVSQAGDAVSFNRRFVEMWGISEEVVAMRSDKALIGAVLDKLVDSAAFTERVEYLYTHQDEESRDEISLRDGQTFDRFSAPTRGADGTHYGRIWFFRDITDRRRSEEALREAKDEAEQAREEAERANLAKSEFLSRMSHELRTPMNSILGFGQVLTKKPLPPDQRKSLDHILKAGRHLLNLINEVLDIARIEANRMQLSLEPVRISHIVQETLNLIQPLAAERNCELRDEVNSAYDHYVLADRQRLTQVLLNLVSNAVKYSHQYGVVSLSCRARNNERLRIEVIDTGPGIEPEKLERLFSPFERLGAEGSEVEGTGLGLALSKGLVEVMGGSTGVESAVGHGSTFWIELALVESPKERLQRTREGMVSQSETPTGAKSSTLLYIEDNLANLSLIETIFSDRSDITLLSAMQGQLGRNLAFEHHPDLVLLDLHLPGMSGDEILKELQSDERTRKIPVVVISADATVGHIKDVLAAGARAYLTKPLDVDRFLETVDRILKEREA